MFMLRFDMRAPADGPAPIGDLYQAAIEMAVWSEQNGAVSVVLSEHHASPDGYLPSPIVLASAIAARTSTIPIMVAALLVPLHDPVRLAEDMAVLEAQQQNLSRYPDRRLLMLNIDAGGVQSRRIIDRLVAAEQPQKLAA